MLMLAGLELYPGAIGILNYDTYVLGYDGYLLPLLLAAILGYAIYRRYVFHRAGPEHWHTRISAERRA